MRPPGVQSSFESCDVMIQAKLIAYDQIRQIEDTKEKALLAGAKLT